MQEERSKDHEQPTKLFADHKAARQTDRRQHITYRYYTTTLKMKGCHCERSEAISVGDARLTRLLRRSAPRNDSSNSLWRTSTLILPWNAAEAEPSAFTNFNRDEYSARSVGASSQQVRLTMLSQVNATEIHISRYPAEATSTAAVQLFSDMSMYSLQTHAFDLTYLHQYALDYVNRQKPGFAVHDDGSWVMFSW